MVVVALLALLASAGCAGAGGPSGPPDAPVAASEPREQLTLDADLVPGSACEQAFDLALYEDRGIVMIAWSEATPRCTARHALVTYLPRKTSADAVLALAKQHATSVRMSTPPTSPSADKR